MGFEPLMDIWVIDGQGSEGHQSKMTRLEVTYCDFQRGSIEGFRFLLVKGIWEG
jgi:hypothetical protein